MDTYEAGILKRYLRWMDTYAGILKRYSKVSHSKCHHRLWPRDWGLKGWTSLKSEGETQALPTPFLTLSVSPRTGYLNPHYSNVIA